VPCRYHSPNANNGENSELEAFIETTETPDFIVAKVNGTMHRAVGSITWCGSLLERNNRAKFGDRTREMILSGEEGFRLARKNIPDLILLDMMLPKVSGLDVLRALKGDVLVKNIPVIVLSGLGQANEVKLMSEGAAALRATASAMFSTPMAAVLSLRHP